MKRWSRSSSVSSPPLLLLLAVSDSDDDDKGVGSFVPFARRAELTSETKEFLSRTFQFLARSDQALTLPSTYSRHEGSSPDGQRQPHDGDSRGRARPVDAGGVQPDHGSAADL
ncbi:hypothetical protein C0Q70_09864 [Pomacea canaliculata]|uniref:Uncharacterized protein n=1 Tax=Pomacea canaliculata TaxID=400727 RepID=A0A2T7PB11_POMCA|nr:hypothetical protein C0Q70_09864 [Pomacea canaliculata]